MPKFLYLLIASLFFFLIYTVSTQDISIENNKEYEQKVVIYSKPLCYYCMNAKELLTRKKILYKEVDLTWDMELHQKLIDQTGQTTVPYIFIMDKFIGGFSDLEKLERENMLNSLLANPTM